MSALLLAALLFWPVVLLPATQTAWTPAAPTKFAECRRSQGLPDPACTPGSVLTQDAATVCRAGYAAGVRDVSAATRRAVLAAYDDVDPPRGAYELDHLIPLELGGGNDAANLWPEPALGARNAYDKDLAENALRGAVCGGRIALVEAQRTMATDWRTVRTTGGFAAEEAR